MATLGEYFESEARDCLAQLDRELARPLPDPAELHRAARALRGTAQMAREDRVLRAASALEAAARALTDHTVRWSDDVSDRARRSIADLRTLLDRRAADEILDRTADSVVTRWRQAGIAVAAHPLRAEGATPSEFRAFAAREVAGIIDALENGVQQLTGAPMDRDPLKMILRRQRALLGAARLEEVPVVAEVLRAVDDLTRVIAKLDVGVKREWLDIYRVAREALKGALEPLQRDEDPPRTHALSRLRHMRAELLERYGTGDAVSAAHTTQGFTTATPVQEMPPSTYLPPDVPASPVAAASADEPMLLGEADVVTDADAELLLDDEAAADETLLLLEETAGEGEPASSAADEIILLDDAVAADQDAPTLVLGDHDVDEPLSPHEAALELQDEIVLDIEEESVLALDEADALEPETEPLLTLTDDAVLELEEEVEIEQQYDTAQYEPAPAHTQDTAGDGADEAVPIESLVYDRNEALRRALQLRDILARDDITDAATRAALDELFDLINLALR